MGLVARSVTAIARARSVAGGVVGQPAPGTESFASLPRLSCAVLGDERWEKSRRGLRFGSVRGETIGMAGTLRIEGMSGT